jgi:hypothetical protein
MGKPEMIWSHKISIYLILIGNSGITWHKPRALPPEPLILMNIRSFIGASSALLLAWLGATYFRKVPTERYQKPTAIAAEASGQAEGGSSELMADLGSPHQGNR